MAADPERFVGVPEAASEIYRRLGTRWDLLAPDGRRDVQRWIYRLQLEQQAEAEVAQGHEGSVMLLDRGTVDGAAYWPDGPEQYWAELGTTLARELERYHAVIWMQTCAALGLYDHDQSNPCRFEDAAAAIRSGEEVAGVWANHPRLHRVQAFGTFEEKVGQVRRVLEELI